MRPPHKLKVIGRAPLEISRGILPFNYESDIELLIRSHKVRSFDFDPVLAV